jgi:hypothetical protein
MEVTTLKQYIGTKKVKAEPMVKFAAVAKGWARASKEGDQYAPGYHVQYINPDGSTYDSWSPKDVFEKSYQIAEDLKDSLAIELKELEVHLRDLIDIIESLGFDKIAEAYGPDQAALMLSQYHGMSLYHNALKYRIELLNAASNDNSDKKQYHKNFAKKQYQKQNTDLSDNK